MKLSFYTGGWPTLSWSDACKTAAEMDMSGVELHYSKVEASPLLEGANAGGNRRKFVRFLNEHNMECPCITVNVAKGSIESALADARECIHLASLLQIPNVCLGIEVKADEDEARLVTIIGQLLPTAVQSNIILLVETTGIYADTSRICTMLDRFASDNLAALWNLHDPHYYKGETPNKSIQSLGAYVQHVRICDSEKGESGPVYCLMGEGTLPIDKILVALRSIDYKGHISLCRAPEDIGITDTDIILPQYASVMESYDDSSRDSRRLYDNKRGDGKFIWQKDVLLDMTFSQVLDQLVETFPNQYAFRFTTLNYTRTYEEFREDVDTFARALVALGVKAGDKVAVWSTNLPQWYISFWATVKLGAVLVTMNTAYKIREAEYLLRQADVHTLVMCDSYRDSNYVSIMKELCPELQYQDAFKPLHCKRLPVLRHIITLESKQKGCLTWQDALSFSAQVPKDEVYRLASKVHPDDVCNMQYTSGTTGFPKGVMLTHRNIVNNGKCIGDRMDLSTADRMMIQVPMFHCFGMVLAMTAAMTHSAMLSPIPYFSPKSSLACIKQERITCFHGVPTMFIALLEHKDFNPDDFSYMRTGIMAGSPCPISVMKDVVEKMNMKEITIVFGQTESSPGCTMSSTDDPLEVRVATVGRPLPEIECKIVDPETGEECPDGVNGEFVARGYNLMKGYYKMPDATSSTIDAEGWLHTGDLACRTPEGNFRITGRLKDMIIRGGENIYPKEIEEFLYTHPKIKDVQVIGVPSAQFGEEIMACIVLKQGETMTEKEVKDYVYNNMAKHKVPSYVDFVDSFPMNAAGKILKYKMREDAVKKLGLQKDAAIETA
ncbi:MAG: AMP-binding protein [Clostridia bacterium]|nr:AMP-binding protein [Clostridia bacterium]